MVNYTNLERKEIRKLAMDIADGLVFGSWMIQGGLDSKDMPMVFLTLALGGFPFTVEDFRDDPRFPKNEHTVCLFYEYYSEAGPRSINGYPCFFSHNTLLGDDAKKVLKLSYKFHKAKEAMING